MKVTRRPGWLRNLCNVSKKGPCAAITLPVSWGSTIRKSKQSPLNINSTSSASPNGLPLLLPAADRRPSSAACWRCPKPSSSGDPLATCRSLTISLIVFIDTFPFSHAHKRAPLLLVYYSGGNGTSVELPVSLPVCAWSGSQDTESIPVELPGGVPRAFK